MERHCIDYRAPEKYLLSMKCVSWDWVAAVNLADSVVDEYPLCLDVGGELRGTLGCWKAENGERNPDGRWVYIGEGCAID